MHIWRPFCCYFLGSSFDDLNLVLRMNKSNKYYLQQICSIEHTHFEIRENKCCYVFSAKTFTKIRCAITVRWLFDVAILEYISILRRIVPNVISKERRWFKFSVILDALMIKISFLLKGMLFSFTENDIILSNST